MLNEFVKPQLFDLREEKIERSKLFNDTKAVVKNFNEEEAEAACEALVEEHVDLYFSVLKAKFDQKSYKIDQIRRILG